MKVLLLAAILAIRLDAAAAAAGERFASPQGAGKADGLTREDAARAGDGGLQRMWDGLPAGGTLWLAPGEYPGAALVIRPAASGEKGRTLRGETGTARRAVIRGTFDRENPERSAAPAIKVMEGASRWTVRDLDFRDVGVAIHARGNHGDVTLADLHVTGAREAIRLEGRGRAAAGSRRIRVSDCRFDGFTKSGLRLCPGNTGVRIERCVADAGGREWMRERFHMGFFVESDCDEIVFTDCEARRSYDDAGSEYWNADGFCVEQAGHVRWERCRAFDCTDGGWDSKAARSELIDCFAARNKRNFRFWGGATLVNCLGVHPVFPGGRGGAETLWCRGPVTAERCTFVGADLFETDDGGSIRLQKCLLVRVASDSAPAPPASERVARDACREATMSAETLAQFFADPARAGESSAGFHPVAGSVTEGFRAR